MRVSLAKNSCDDPQDMPLVDVITNPNAVFSRQAVLTKPCPVPAKSGVYAWFFRDIPGIVPAAGCVTQDGLTLLYIGISPKNDRSRENLRRRITYHYRGNAEGSTLRLTLGVLLSGETGYPLRRVGSGNRMTFTPLGEQCLNEWMARNAYVLWIEDSEPWTVEATLLKSLSLPLNIQDNLHHPFSGTLTRLRADAKNAARHLPIAVGIG